MGVSLEQGEHVVDHGVAGVHDLDAQFGMAREEVFEQERVAHGAAELGRGDVSAAGAACAHVDGDGDVELLGEGEVLIDAGIAGREAFILEADFAHDFEAVGGEVLAELVEGDARSGCHALIEAGAGNDAAGRGVLPLLDAGGVAEDDGGDVEAVHFCDDVLDVFALRGGVELGCALFLAPAEGSFFGGGVGGEELRGVGAHGAAAGEGLLHGVDVDVEDGRDVGGGVLCAEVRRGCEEEGEAEEGRDRA